MTDTQETARADLTRLGREAVGRMRLPGPPLGKPLPSRIGSLASSVERFASSLSRPVEIRRSLRGPSSHEESVRPPRWWTGQTPEPSAPGRAVPAGRWLAGAEAVRREELPPRSLPRAARAVPNEETYTPGGIVTGLHAEVARVRRLAEVSAAGPMTSSGDLTRLGAATAARRRAEAARTLPPPTPFTRPAAAAPEAPALEPVRRATRTSPSAPRAAARPAGQSPVAPASNAPAPVEASATDTAPSAEVAAPTPARPAEVVRRSTKKAAAKPSARAVTETAPAGDSPSPTPTASNDAGPDGSGSGSAAPVAAPEPAPASAASGAAGTAPNDATPGGPSPSAAETNDGPSVSAPPGDGGSPMEPAGPASPGLARVPTPGGATAALARFEAPGVVVRRRASFQLRPAASRLAASFSRGEPTRSAAAPGRAAGVLRRSMGTGESIRAASGTLIASAPGLGAREVQSAAGLVRRLARGRADELRTHTAPAPLRAVPNAAAPPTRPAVPGASPAPAAPPSAAVPNAAVPNAAVPNAAVPNAAVPNAAAPSTPGAPRSAPSPSRGAAPTPLRRLAVAPAHAAVGESSTAAASSVSPEPVVRRAPAGSLSRSTGRWAAETLAGGAPTLAGLGVAMPDLMATRRVSDRTGEGPLASGFGEAAEIRPATGDLIGSVGSSSSRLSTPATGGVVRRSYRPRVVSSSGLPLLTPQLMARSAFQGAVFEDTAAPASPAQGTGGRGPNGPAGRAPSSPAPRTGAPALPGRADHGDGPAAPTLRRLASAPRPAPRGAAGLPGGANAARGAAGDVVRRAVIRRLFNDQDDDFGPALGDMFDETKAVQRDARERLRAMYGRKRPATPSDPETAKKQHEEQRATVEQMRRNSPYSRDTSRRARAMRARLEQEGGGVRKPGKSLLESTKHLFVSEDENGVAQPRPTRPVPATTGTDTPGGAGVPAKREARRRRRLPRVELDRITDAVIARIEQRVIDELERRGRRDGRGGF